MKWKLAVTCDAVPKHVIATAHRRHAGSRFEEEVPASAMQDSWAVDSPSCVTFSICEESIFP